VSGTGGQTAARGALVEVEVESLAYGGAGVARLGPDGLVVFVDGAVEGDQVLAQIYKRRRDYAQARAVELLRPSPLRIEPLADHPGAPWQVLPYNRQLAVKEAQVKEALAKLGHLEGFAFEGIVPAVERWRYRNKVEFSFGFDREGRPVLGFHAPARWNRVVEVTDCLLCSKLANEALAAAREWAAAAPYLPWERGAEGGRRAGPDERGRARLRNLVIREGRRTGELLVRLVVTPGELDAGGLLAGLRKRLGSSLAGFLITRLEALGETTQGGETELLYGSPFLRERLADLELEIPYEAFFQTNTEMAELLYQRARAYAQADQANLIFDLYCGLGVIGLLVAGRQRQLVGIELSPQAVAAAERIAAANVYSKARFHQGEVAKALPAVLAQTGRPEVVVVDPPRAGLGRRAVAAVLQAAPNRLVYVSCNPTTLAGDGARFAAAGYRLTRVCAVDMFPQTHHVECVACFERSG